ncbi:MAG: hypothetical protein AB1757_01750 [Acidobacteriota bacterium]
MSNYPPPGEPPFPPSEGVPTRPMNPQPPYQQNPYQQGQYQQPPFPPPNQPQKKGGAVKWVLIGCIGFILIGGIAAVGVVWYGYNKAKQIGFDPDLAKRNPAFAAAKLAINLDPDKELISADEKTNTLTVKDKKSGKVLTLTFEQDSNGNITFKEKDASGKETSVSVGKDKVEVTSPDGKTVIGANADSTLPDWVPQYPGVKMEGTYSSVSGESIAKGCNFKTNDSLQQVISFFEDKLKAQGFKTTKTTSEINGKQYMNLSANDGDYTRFVVVGANEQDGGVYVTITSQQNKKKN